MEQKHHGDYLYRLPWWGAVEGVAPFNNIFDPSTPGNVLADNVRVISHTEGFNIVDFLSGISRK